MTQPISYFGNGGLPDRSGDVLQITAKNPTDLRLVILLDRIADLGIDIPIHVLAGTHDLMTIAFDSGAKGNFLTDHLEDVASIMFDHVYNAIRDALAGVANPQRVTYDLLRLGAYAYRTEQIIEAKFFD